jgi:hypothetical protein
VLDPLRPVAALARLVLPAPGGRAPAEAPAVRWSMAPEDLVASLVARQAFAVVVQRRRTVRTPRRIKLLFVPLQEVREGILLGTPVSDWFVHVSTTGRGAVTRLPTDPNALADRLGLPAGGDGATVREALRQLGEQLYGERLP